MLSDIIGFNDCNSRQQNYELKYCILLNAFTTHMQIEIIYVC